MQIGTDQRDGTSRRNIQWINVVRTTHWLRWHIRTRTPQVRHQVTGCRSRSGDLTVLQTPLLFALVNDPQVVDAGVCLGCLPGTHKIGYSDCGQQTNDGYHNHDLHKREPTPPFYFECFHDFNVSTAAELHQRRMYE